MTRNLPILAAGLIAASALVIAPAAMAAGALGGHEAYEAALKSLHQAEDDLGKTPEDSSGHKAKALERLHQAIGETDAAAADSELKKKK